MRPLGNVLITGGASGLGAATVEAVRADGGQPLVLDRAAPAVDVPYELADLADRTATEQAVATLVARAGHRLDAVFTAAGIDSCGPLGGVAADEWERVVQVNLLGTARVVRAALPYLERSGGTVVTCSSTLGLKALPDATAYCAAKFGVIGFTRALAAETRGRIGVTLLIPGGMHTAFFDGRTAAGRQTQPARGCGGHRGVRPAPATRLPAAGDGGLFVGGVVLAVRSTLLVLRALGLGDLLTAVPALRGLRAAYPAHRIVLAAPAPLAELAALTGAVDELLPTAELGIPEPGAREWGTPSPAVAVNLHGRGPESTRLLRALHPGVLLAHRHPEVPGPDWQTDLHEVRRWCRFLEHFGIPADPADLGLARPVDPSPAPGAVVVHPGCAFVARRWPAERYAVVARRLAAAGLPVVVTGNPAERRLALRVAAEAGLPQRSVLAGRTGLSQLAALVADGSLVVCGDTGIAHLATAYGTPSVVLFGPVSPQHWGPPPRRPQHVALWAGSTGDTFAARPDPGLLRITPGEVLAAAARLFISAVPATDTTRQGG